MTINENMSHWAGKPVVDWTTTSAITDPAGTAYRLRIEFDEDGEWLNRFAEMLQDPRAAEMTAFVAGSWGFDQGDSSAVVEALVEAAGTLPRLTAIFLGDITFEENEISWIHQSDLSSLFVAYPALQHFGARGGNGLRLGPVALRELRSLVIETGGMSREVAQDALAADLPALEHLELWLGTENYGANVSVDDIAPLLTEDAPDRWPNLRYLGLRDSEIADDIANALANAPLLAQIHTLDLSLGTLGNAGVAALAASPMAARLHKLDIHHHYASPESVAGLIALGIEVNAGDAQGADEDGEEDRYVAVGE